MALIECKECNQQISDKAKACPHCGYPVKIEGLVELLVQSANDKIKQTNSLLKQTNSLLEDIEKKLLFFYIIGIIGLIGAGIYLIFILIRAFS